MLGPRFFPPQCSTLAAERNSWESLKRPVPVCHPRSLNLNCWVYIYNVFNLWKLFWRLVKIGKTSLNDFLPSTDPMKRDKLTWLSTTKMGKVVQQSLSQRQCRDGRFPKDVTAGTRAQLTKSTHWGAAGTLRTTMPAAAPGLVGTQMLLWKTFPTSASSP